MSGYGEAALIASLLATGAGTGIQISEQKSANKRRQSEINRIREASAKSGEKQRKLTINEAEKLAPANRQERLKKAERKITGELSRELELKRGDTTDVDFSGNVSDAFTRGKGLAEAKSLEDAYRQAKLTARVSAPGTVLGQEAQSYANTAARKDTEGSNLRALLRLYEGNLGGVQPSDAGLITGEALKTLGTVGAIYQPRYQGAGVLPVAKRRDPAI